MPALRAHVFTLSARDLSLLHELIGTGAHYRLDAAAQLGKLLVVVGTWRATTRQK
jgi:hypothetical protein